MSWPFGRGDIDGDRLLVAVGAQIERVVVVRLALGVVQVGRAEGAGVVAAAGAFDLDHLGAEIGQHLRRQGASEHPRQVENFDARKWQSRHELPPNFLAWWRGNVSGALRSQADTLFCATEPCITGMTPSVRRPLCAQVAGRTRVSAVSKGSGCGIPGKGNSRTSQKHDGPPKRAVLSSNRVRPARLPVGAGLGAAGPPFQEFAIQGIAVLRGKRCGRCSSRRGGGAAPDAADTAAPAGSGMLRSSHSCAALKRVQPDTVARGAISFHFGWNGGRCNCATLSNMVSTRSDRRR